MQRILLTGMSGTGKSTLVEALAERGYKAIDADCDTYSHWVALSELDTAAGEPVEADRDWVWREDQIQALLATEDTQMLILSGCASNMGKFLAQFNQIVLLSTPADVIVERLQSRINNQYGKQPEEVARVLGLIESVEPLLRAMATYEINTNAPLDEILALLVQHIAP
jgi:shikimate kinase